jgi:hypothetical protein
MAKDNQDFTVCHRDFAARRVATASHGKEGVDMLFVQKATEFDQEMTIERRGTSRTFLSQTIIIEVISDCCMIDVMSGLM